MGVYIWPKVSLTWNSSKLGQEMSLLGGTSDQRSAWPEIVPNLATQCLNLGVHLTVGQPDLKQFQTWSQDVAPGGYIWPMVSLTWSSSKLGHKMLLPGRLCLAKSQPDPKADQMSSWPAVVPVLATTCLYQGYVLPNVKLTSSSTTHDQQMPLPGEYNWPKVSLTQRLTKCQVDLK